MHFVSRQLFDPVVHLLNLFFLRGGAQSDHVFVIFAVISQVMAIRQNCLYIIGIGADPSAGHEKGGFHIVGFQNRQYIRGILIAPGSIKREGDLFFGGVHTVDGQFAVTDFVPGLDSGFSALVDTAETGNQAQRQHNNAQRHITGHVRLASGSF